MSTVGNDGINCAGGDSGGSGVADVGGIVDAVFAIGKCIPSFSSDECDGDIAVKIGFTSEFAVVDVAIVRGDCGCCVGVDAIMRGDCCCGGVIATGGGCGCCVGVTCC